jgi:hypothetical protein
MPDTRRASQVSDKTRPDTSWTDQGPDKTVAGHDTGWTKGIGEEMQGSDKTRTGQGSDKTKAGQDKAGQGTDKTRTIQ